MLRHFVSLVRTVQVTVFSAGERVRGDWVPGQQSVRSERLIIIPITPTQLRVLPEGKYCAGDIRAYHKGSPRLNDGDAISYKGASYMVRDVADRELDGNYTMYLARREDG